MKTFYSSVVELRERFVDVIETHPFECGWADEAIFFVERHESVFDSPLALRVQLSADGIRWMDEGTVITLTDTAFARITHFGGFLRLAGTTMGSDGQAVPATISVRLALKG